MKLLVRLRLLWLSCAGVCLLLPSAARAQPTFTWNGTWSPSTPPASSTVNRTLVFNADYTGNPTNLTASGTLTIVLGGPGVDVNLTSIGTPLLGPALNLVIEGTGDLDIGTLNLLYPNSRLTLNSANDAPLDNLDVTAAATSFGPGSTLAVDRGSEFNSVLPITSLSANNPDISGEGIINGACLTCDCPAAPCPACSDPGNPLICPSGSVLLPVVLVQFVGERLPDGGIALTWATASEENAQHFEVQRGNDGSRFSTVATVGATGNSRELRTYGFTDADAGSGRHFYRLRQVDLDGTVAYSTVIEVGPHVRTSPWVVYPNPVTAPLQVTLVSTDLRPDDVHLLRVYTAQGKLLANVQGALGTVREQLNRVLAQAPPGTYLVRLESRDHAQQLRLVRP